MYVGGLLFALHWVQFHIELFFYEITCFYDRGDIFIRLSPFNEPKTMVQQLLINFGLDRDRRFKIILHTFPGMVTA